MYLSSNALNGTVPAMDFSRITDYCYLNNGGGNHFTCPLPPGAAEYCHGTCTAGGCIGSSANLSATDCGAWTDLWDATNGPGWKHCNDQASRLDPCSCAYHVGFLPKGVRCPGSHITTLYVRARGSAPAPFASPALCLRPASCHW